MNNKLIIHFRCRVNGIKNANVLARSSCTSKPSLSCEQGLDCENIMF